MAASPRPPSWANEHTKMSAGVLGETAPALAERRRALGLKFESRVCGTITHAKGAKGGKEFQMLECRKRANGTLKV